MSELKTNNSNIESTMELKQQVNEKLEILTMEIPDYSELTKEGKRIVNKYISIIDLNNEKTIDDIAKYELKRIYAKLEILKATMETCYTRIENIITEVKEIIAENNESERKVFFNLLKKSPLVVLKNLKNNSNEIQDNGRTYNLTNIDIISGKLESIRIELRINSGKLENIAQNSEKQFVDTQYQIIALQEVLKKLQKDKIKQTQILEKTFFQGCQDSTLVRMERKLLQKINYCIGINRNAKINFITSRLLAQRNEQIASDYEKYLKILLPELKTITSISKMIDAYNEFLHMMNEKLKTESEYSKEAIRKVQDISTGSAIDAETAKVLTSNVLEGVTSLKAVQDAGRPTNEAFTEILDDFRSKLTRELDGNIGQDINKGNTNNIEER